MNYIESEWRKLLIKIINEGKLNKKDDSEVLEILGYNTFVKNPINDFVDQNSNAFLHSVQDGWYDVEGYVMTGESIAQYMDGMILKSFIAMIMTMVLYILILKDSYLCVLGINRIIIFLLIN